MDNVRPETIRRRVRHDDIQRCGVRRTVKGRGNAVLEILHLPRERRLGKPEFLGGLGEAQIVSHRHEVTQMAKLHSRSIR